MFTQSWRRHTSRSCVLLLSTCTNAAAADAELFPQLGHDGDVYTVAFSHDGHTLASGGNDNTVRLWDTRSGELIRTLVGHEHRVRSVSFSPDGRTLASGSNDRTVRLWNTESGALVRSIDGQEAGIASVAFGPEGRTLALGGEDGTLHLWNAQSGTLVQSLEQQKSGVNAVAFSPDGRSLASGGNDSSVRVWDLRSGEIRWRLEGHGGIVSSLAFSPDGRTLASGSSDYTVRLWDLQSGKHLRTLAGHESFVRSLAFSPDGRSLASGGYDDSVRLWSVRTGALEQTVAHADWVNSVAYSPDGRTFASAGDDNSVRLWNAKSGELVRTLAGHEGWVRAVAASPDGRTVASGGNDGNVRVWNARSGALVRTLASSGFDDSKRDGIAHPGGVTRTRAGQGNPVRSVAFGPGGPESPGRQLLASGGEDGAVRVWNVNSGQLLHFLEGHERSVQSLAFSPDGRFLASGGDDDTVRLWSARSGEHLRTLTGQQGGILSVSFGPDSRILASGSSSERKSLLGLRLTKGKDESTLRLWNALSGDLVRTFESNESTVYAVGFSPDGRTLASGDDGDTVRLWDVKTGGLVRSLEGHRRPVRSVVFSPDGRTLASGSADGTVRLWGARSGETVRVLVGHGSWVRSVSFSADGQLLATGSDDATVRLWNLESGAATRVFVTLPGTQWIAWRPDRLRYVSSPQGDESVALRFGSDLRSLFPLDFYRDDLRANSLEDALSRADPEIEPQRIRLFWVNTPNKPYWFAGVVIAAIVVAAFLRLLMDRGDPLAVARRFFAAAGATVNAVRKKEMLGVSFAGDAVPSAVGLWTPDHRLDNAGSIRGWKETLAKLDAGKLYLVVPDSQSRLEAPRPTVLHAIRRELAVEIVPISSRRMQAALVQADAARSLTALEEPYVTRTDPYLESKPITDPTLFYGRREWITQLPMALAQGQHVCVVGLRKVGKTSLLQQISQHFADRPQALIDCQALAEPRANLVFGAVLRKLAANLDGLGATGLPVVPDEVDARAFTRTFHALLERWQQSGRRERVLVVFDEIDKLFPNPNAAGSREALADYVKVFKALRAEAQTNASLSMLVAAYRPDVNRRNLLGEYGENPMFSAYTEAHIGFLDPAESKTMLQEIGAWRDIVWTDEAADGVFRHCAGHPLLTRYFASECCEQGKRKHIDLAVVAEAAEQAVRNLRRSEIGNYFKEAVWDLLSEPERDVLARAYAQGHGGLAEDCVPAELESALTNLERFGVLTPAHGRCTVAGSLLQAWLGRRVSRAV